MNDVVSSLLLGVIAGIIDIIPMIIQKMDRNACLSAFFHWVALGLIIPFIAWNIAPWLKGLIVAELTAIPIIFLVASKDKNAIIPIIIMSAILGIGIGFFSGVIKISG